MKQPFYITTPIYYPSNKLHIGNTYTTVATDCIARYKKMRGYDVKYVTGTDEHGLKIEKVAQNAGKTPIAFLDEMIGWIKALWKTMDIDYDIFIRTTSDFHEKVIQKIFRRLYEQGDIYKGSYEGLYCVPCETFFTERQLKDGKCPDCGRPVEPIKEEAYFFRMTKYADKLIKYYEEHPDFIVPSFRKNEMLQNFLRPGLEDLCVSRTSFKWGIPVDFDDKHVVYVWIDALSSYLTALGYMCENDADMQRYWPADVHFVGKDIIRFHVIIWPILLMALDLPLPKQVFVHGFYTIDGEKISKSKDNMVDPTGLVNRYGLDAIRYFLLRELPYGADGNYTAKALLDRINFDLANDFGNLLSRTVGMIEKYFGGKLPDTEDVRLSEGLKVFEDDLKNTAITTVKDMEHALDEFRFADSLNAVWTLIRRTNKYADECRPWELVKDESRREELAAVLYDMAEVLRQVAIMVYPFMPNTPKHIFRQLGIGLDKETVWDSLYTFGVLHRNVIIEKGDIVFPRLDVDKELLEIAAAYAAEKEEESKTETKTESEKPEGPPIITINDFVKLDLRVGEVVECEAVPKSDKLLKSQINLGGRTVQILSGIGKFYKPEDMVGKRVVVVTNLKPVKLMGHISNGMVLAASDEDGNLNLIAPDGEIGSGALVK